MKIHFGLLYLGLILFLIPVSVYILSQSQKKDPPQEKVLASKIAKTDSVQKKENKIKEITEEYLISQDGDYSVVVKNLKTDEEFNYDSDKKYDSASLYKLWVMAVTYQQIKDGEIKEDDVVSASLNSLEDVLSTITPTTTPEGFTSPSITGEPEKISMTVGEALEKMITVSDNYAALLLSSKVGSKKIAGFIKDSGFTNSNYNKPPQTSAKDMSLFYVKLYQGEIVDETYSEIMIELLKKQTLSDRIPKYLEEDVEVAHKTGELFGSKHDAGIVFSKNDDYVIVVLTETKDYKKAAENIAKYSEAVYKYFEKS